MNTNRVIIEHESYSIVGMMIDALFGSKTRVKLLHLFLNNPGKAFYVREITRLIDEQINSVRRELANMLEVGVITSDSADNKLYYQVNQRYQHYVPLRAIFADEQPVGAVKPSGTSNWQKFVTDLPSLRVAIASGVLIQGSASPIDLLLVGDVPAAKARQAVKQIESLEAREINYTLLNYDEFYYRLSVRDKFITEILGGKYAVLVDTDNILKQPK